MNEEMFCPNCGSKQEKENKFCGNCGFKFEENDESKSSDNSNFKTSNKENADKSAAKENNFEAKTSNNNSQILNSPFSMTNELKKFNFIYFIFAIIGTFIDSYTRILGGLAGILLAYLIIDFIARYKVGNIRIKLFDLPNKCHISYKELADIITIPLAKINMSVEVLSDSLRITCKGIEYDIFIFDDKGKFKIWPQENFFKRIFSKIYINTYLKSIYAVPIIVYTIQHSLINKSNNEDGFEEKLILAEKNMNLFFKNKLKTQLICGSMLFITLFILAAFTCGSDGDEYIDIVKNGNFNSYTSATVGESFDNFFTDEKWEYFESDNGKDIVEFNGNCLKNEKDCHVCIQFEINDSDDTFEVSYYALDGEPQDLFTWAGMLEKIYEEY